MNAQFPVIPLPERKARLDIPAGRIRLVIDTDTKNEVDDQFAISWALRSPDRFRVEAVYAAPSTLLPSPVLRDDLSWGKPDASRHPIRVVNYCYRDLIFGDMFACLTQE